MESKIETLSNSINKLTLTIEKMEFKDKLIYARAVLKYSQTKMAEELGVSYATINRWENGNNAPSKTMIVLFENYCKKHGITFER